MQGKWLSFSTASLVTSPNHDSKSVTKCLTILSRHPLCCYLQLQDSGKVDTEAKQPTVPWWCKVTQSWPWNGSGFTAAGLAIPSSSLLWLYTHLCQSRFLSAHWELDETLIQSTRKRAMVVSPSLSSSSSLPAKQWRTRELEKEEEEWDGRASEADACCLPCCDWNSKWILSLRWRRPRAAMRPWAWWRGRGKEKKVWSWSSSWSSAALVLFLFLLALPSHTTYSGDARATRFRFLMQHSATKLALYSVRVHSWESLFLSY